MTPNELVFTFRGSYVCANFGENRSRNATVRVLGYGQTHTQTHTYRHTDANRYYNLSHAICYSYGTDNYDKINDSSLQMNKCKKTTFIKTVIGDVVAHLKPQKFTVLSDF